MRSMRRLVLMGSISVIVICGCKGNRQSATTDGALQQAEKMPEATKDPIELVVYYPFGDDSPDSFQKNYWQIVQKKYPNFHVKWVNTKTLTMNDLAATQTAVDIIFSNANHAAQLADFRYVSDMNELIQTYKFDLGRINPTAIDIIKKASNGMLTALPIYINNNLMFYNKDLFDKFGVSYPVDGMTWDDTYSLAKKLTRYDNGIQYVGFSYHFLNGNMLWLNSYGQEEMDSKTKKVTFDSGRWPDIMRNFLRFFEIPGHEFLIGNASLNGFAKEQRIAMQITYSNRVIGNPDQVPPNWDIVSHPVYEDLKGVGSGIEPLYFYLSSVSKHKNEAFLAITALLEDEAQKMLAQRGFYPAVKIPDLKSAYSQVIGLKGKNVEAMFVNQFAPAVTMSQDVLAIRPSLSGAALNVMTGKKDVNTALREAADEGNKKLQERIASGLSN